MIETKDILLLKDIDRLKARCNELNQRIFNWKNPSDTVAKILLLGGRGSGKSRRNFQENFLTDKTLGTYINTVYCSLNDGYYKVYAVTSVNALSTTAW